MIAIAYPAIGQIDDVIAGGEGLGFVLAINGRSHVPGGEPRTIEQIEAMGLATMYATHRGSSSWVVTPTDPGVIAGLHRAQVDAMGGVSAWCETYAERVTSLAPLRCVDRWVVLFVLVDVRHTHAIARELVPMYRADLIALMPGAHRAWLREGAAVSADDTVLIDVQTVVRIPVIVPYQVVTVPDDGGDPDVVGVSDWVDQHARGTWADLASFAAAYKGRTLAALTLAGQEVPTEGKVRVLRQVAEWAQVRARVVVHRADVVGFVNPFESAHPSVPVGIGVASFGIANHIEGVERRVLPTVWDRRFTAWVTPSWVT